MNYPTELQKIMEKTENQDWVKTKRKCWAAENGGCFCTGKCEGKPEFTGVDQMAYKAGDKP